MAQLDTQAGIDWTACELMEQIPGKVSGRPIVRGTRILPDGIVNSYDMGESIEEVREGFPSLSVDQMKRLIDASGLKRRCNLGRAYPRQPDSSPSGPPKRLGPKSVSICTNTGHCQPDAGGSHR